MVTNRPVILTRPLADTRRLAMQIRKSDPTLAVHCAPLMAIHTVPHCLKTPADCAGMILTSANAIRSLDPAADVAGLTAWCVGPHTGEAARERGLDVRIAAGSAADLIELMRTQPPAGRVLYPRGTHIATPLTEILEDAGIRVREIITYDQLEVPMSPAMRTMLDRQCCLVSLYSVRTAQIFSRQAGDLQDPGHIILCRSMAIATAVGSGWTTHHVDGEANLVPTLLSLARTPLKTLPEPSERKRHMQILAHRYNEGCIDEVTEVHGRKRSGQDHRSN